MCNIELSNCFISYAQELNTISMFHLRVMLRQMLTTENIPNIRDWEETLLKLALRIARELTFTAHPHRQGADMDVRRYVKIKKIPGGSPKNSEYVDGAVITKNVAHRNMIQSQRNPRVMLVTFPLEFNRIEGQYVHFGQILLQEKDYLSNLANRIAALRPHVVLVEKSVSRLVLDALADRKIAVARAVKPSAIQFVARMTQGDVFSSMDKLALEPRLGHCAQFKVQTFDHPLIPGKRKAYMRFEGCNREMGCTIILRGGDINVLKRVKKVTRFLAFIVRNLRLETHLWKDSVITLPPLSKTATPSAPSSVNLLSPLGLTGDEPSPAEKKAELHTLSGSPASDPGELQGEEAEQQRLSRRIQESLEPYERTFISVSATLRFPPPHPIRRMKELDDELRRVRQEWEDDLVRREERPSHGHEQEETILAETTPSLLAPQPVDSSDLVAQINSLAVPEYSRTPTPGLIPPTEPPDYFGLPPNSSTKSLTSSSVVSSPAHVIVEEEPIQPKSVNDIALESRLSYVKWQHEEQRRIWEWYLRKNKDDFDVEKYQCISLWEFTLPITEYGLHRACFPPQLQYITFYGENDCTLGQFIEKSVRDSINKFLDSKAICEGKGCGQPIARHCKVYVHNETRLFVALERWDGQITDPHGYHAHASLDSIITWSACRVCGSATPFIPVSEEMLRYSFAKFLELHFYPADVQLVQGAGCQHNIYRHHVRYFASQGMTVRFQADSIVLHEIVYPPMRIRVRPETQLEIKNRDFDRLHHRNNVWYSALIDDLKLINIDAATGDEEADAMLTGQINSLILRAEGEKNEVTRFINKVYRDSASTDTLALNQVRAKRQDYIVAWQADFDKLPKPRLTQLADKNIRRLSAFGTVRAMWPRRGDFEYSQASANTSEAEEYITPTARRATGDSFASSASEASETESVAEEPFAPSRTEPSSVIPVPTVEPIPSMSPKSDGESDSTIGAPRGEPSVAEGEDEPLQVRVLLKLRKPFHSHYNSLPRSCRPR
jgi:1-phosphatidylinositol-3-phosphate 5-kinase